ncbi:DUF6461 domain-containing protein [Spirillospora sp. CA-253888]
MHPTATDYTWFDELFSGDLAEAYCLTVALRLSPEEYLRRLDAEVTGRWEGVAGMADHALEIEGRSFVAVTLCESALGPAVLAVEPNGYLGVTEDVMATVSAGTTAVSHFRNINWLDGFLWTEDGRIRLRFEPYLSSECVGSVPDELVAQMRESGFDLRPGLSDEELGPYSAAAFALAERIGGVRVTPDLLAGSAYLCGTVRSR